jgi:hypothetical protein
MYGNPRHRSQHDIVDPCQKRKLAVSRTRLCILDTCRQHQLSKSTDGRTLGIAHNRKRQRGSTMMISNRQRAEFPEGVLVLSGDTSAKETPPPVQVIKASNDSDPEPQQRSGGRSNPVASRAAQWASMNSNDREVFNIWARGVVAFYSLLIISLLVAVLLGAHAPAGGAAVSTASTMERSSPELPAPRTRSGK